MPKCIGILTSGGDAPGMNAAIRAVTRSAIFNGIAVKGIYRGYRGLVTNEIVEFKTQNVSNIIQVGGTILKTARCMEFRTEEGRKIAYDNMVNAGIDSLVVIGGDGSLTGARIFATEYNIPIVGLPEQSTTTYTEPTRQSDMTLPSTPSCNVWTKSATRRLHTSVCSSSR